MTLADKLPGEVVTLVVQEWGNAIEVGGGTGARPERIISEDAIKQFVLANARMTRIERGLLWTRRPEVVQPPAGPFDRDGARRVLVYDDYDEEGNGIGEPIGHRWAYTYGWYALGVRLP